MILEFLKKDDDAVIPRKAGVDEVGYDLTLIKVSKVVNDKTIMYDTGVAVKPPDGYYTEIIPRSSIYKSGWMIANGVGVIDPTYRDTLKIVLVQISSDAAPIVLPCRIAQLIVRPLVRNIETVVVEDMDMTYRKGGFGSTDLF